MTSGNPVPPPGDAPKQAPFRPAEGPIRLDSGRRFLGFDLSENTPDHSSLCRIRQRLDVEVHQEVFGFVLKILAQKGLLRGKTIGIDATTLDANAALRSIVRREDGTNYQEFLEGIAKASGIETPTRADLARVDKKRPKKGSNDDWTNPHDPDAKIVKLKDGRTHLAHKNEHVVDMETGAVLAVTVHGGAAGDAQIATATLEAADETLFAIQEDPDAATAMSPDTATAPRRNVTSAATVVVAPMSPSRRAGPSCAAIIRAAKPANIRPNAMPISGPASSAASPPPNPTSAKVRMPATRLPSAASRSRQPRSSPINRPIARARPSRWNSSISLMCPA